MNGGSGHSRFCELTHVQLTEERAATVATCVRDVQGNLAERLAKGVADRELTRRRKDDHIVAIPSWAVPLVEHGHLFVTPHGTLEATPWFTEMCLGYPVAGVRTA